ncbi:MAG: DUF364 domain-containing protein [Deltaproteobacteria bacterium]|nr:DUF364 domain-containing protein [Deltaproteobacteria bacterium]
MREQGSIIPESTADRIVTFLAEVAREARVAEVRIGLGYIAVMLAGGGTGVAFTFRDEAKGGCSIFNGVRPLSQRSAYELLVFLKSRDPIEAGVGLACANALANREMNGYLGGDILDHLDLRSDDRVGMVGYFAPLVSAIQSRARLLTVFERAVHRSELLRPQEEAVDELPRCDVALFTATAIMNHTMDALLKASESCREVAVLGASTPLLPAAFEGKKVTLLSGVLVRNPQEILRVVSEGGGMRFFGPHVRKVSLRVSADSRSFSTRATT